MYLEEAAFWIGIYYYPLLKSKTLENQLGLEQAATLSVLSQFTFERLLRFLCLRVKGTKDLIGKWTNMKNLSLGRKCAHLVSGYQCISIYTWIQNTKWQVPHVGIKVLHVYLLCISTLFTLENIDKTVKYFFLFHLRVVFKNYPFNLRKWLFQIHKKSAGKHIIFKPIRVILLG